MRNTSRTFMYLSAFPPFYSLPSSFLSLPELLPLHHPPVSVRHLYNIHFTVVAKKNTDAYIHTHSHIQNIQIYTYTEIIYTHTTVYVEAIELHDMADTISLSFCANFTSSRGYGVVAGKY